ncbi:hypothetical protein BKG82_27025 [Mycobacteroides chelonae]|uniref:AAA family ATPase n=1 Tax=Mycobacteroides chelonae TaxID=1774 RepID=A0A1S1LHX7_MYCCH|nr:AAA family ATPase [Mycobacteroides chelonae]OHU47307.1 hypothetical protein BKG82_27025 [Mycobacteroides chelonae]
MSAVLEQLTIAFGGNMPSYLVVCGPPAAGKSTLAASLAAAGWVHLDKDCHGDRLSPQIMAALGRDPQDRDSPDYRRFGHGLALRLLALAAVDELSAGRRVAIEAPFIGACAAAASAGTGLREILTERYGFPEGAATVWVSAPAEVRWARMSARGAARDAAKLADWDAYAATIPQHPAAGTIDVVLKGDWQA